MATTINWTGKSGKKYKYYIYEMGASFKANGGNYAFAKKTKPGSWSPVYFGETGDLSERFDNHHKMACAKRNGATHVHAHLNTNSQNRLNEEADLIANWSPACNG